MAEIVTYSPRTVNGQNKDHLPSTHDSEKRTSYVQITLTEEEINEAVRNYIRAQVPVSCSDELPVVLVAGRGKNGHSAVVTVSVQPIEVVSPEVPTEPMATFDEAAADAARRNGDATPDQESEVEATQEENVSTEEVAEANEGNPVAETQPEAEPAQQEETPDAGETEEPNKPEKAEQEAPPKRSNLFGPSAEKGSEEPAGDTETQQEDEAPEEEEKKPKNIFDSL